MTEKANKFSSFLLAGVLMTCVCNSFEIASSLNIMQQGYNDLSGSKVDHDFSDIYFV
jgi:hypothetical protein